MSDRTSDRTSDGTSDRSGGPGAGATRDRADLHWMSAAVELSRNCPPAAGAYSVGAVIVDAAGDVVTTGYSRETTPRVHAEEAALAKVSDADRPRLAGATIYTTLEPCSARASATTPCAQLILAAGLPRVVLAWREPDLFVADCQGVELLDAGGVEVVELPDFVPAVREINQHLDV
jgi:diaminohydroxyphosphoribosylaminopyrimidine deaminase/5-amino-6-(5-phosphoribosylamino)uracil reductase